MPPEVSIIIPAYNTESYIAQAIESVLSQTIQNIEVFVIDDGSTDQTLPIARSFADQRLNILSNSRNIGVSATRNRGLDKATAKWIAVLDADDWYAPDRLEKLLNIAEAENADMIADNLSFIQDGATQPWSTLIQESELSLQKVNPITPQYFVETGIYGCKGLHLGLSKPLYRRDFLNQHHIRYNETLKVAEDFDFDLNCLVHGASFLLVPAAYYFYRSRPGSLITQDKLRHIHDFYQSTLSFYNLDIVQSNPDLLRALHLNLKNLKKNQSYYKVVQPFKKKRYLEAFMEMTRNPIFFPLISQRFKNILQRRIRYFISKDPLVYKLLHH